MEDRSQRRSPHDQDTVPSGFRARAARADAALAIVAPTKRERNTIARAVSSVATPVEPIRRCPRVQRSSTGRRGP